MYLDNDNREWSVAITTYEVKRCKEELKFNLCAIFDNSYEGLSELCNDMDRLGSVLWVICREQAEKKNVDERAFLTALTGAAIDSALTAVKEALIAFFPPRKSKVLRDIFRQNDQQMAHQEEVNHAIMDLLDRSDRSDAIIEALQQVTENLDQQNRLTEKNFTETSLRSPASAASTPDHSLSAS
jgi:hypothetical protein